MYVGHALLAFALTGGVLGLTGADGRDVITLAVIGGCYGMLPDIDLIYTVYAVVDSGPTGIFPTTEHVWTESWVIHRTLTHSVVVGTALVAVVLGAATACSDGPVGSFHRTSAAALDATATPGSVLSRPLARRLVGGTFAVVVSAGLLWIAFTADGVLGVTTMSLLLAGALSLVIVGHRHGVGVPWLVGAAIIGILSHPLGDLWMGRPPVICYPFGPGREFPSITFAVDPTLNFVVAFMIEIGLAWASLLVWLSGTGRTLRTTVRPIAGIGVGAVLALWLVPAPTFAVAYQFSIGVLGLGALAGGYTLLSTERRSTALVTGVAATTLGLCSYLLAYLVVGRV